MPLKSVKNRTATLSLLIMGFMVPGLMVYAFYISAHEYYKLDVYKRSGVSFDFRRNFLNNRLKKRIPFPDMVILGDSSAKSTIIPQRMENVLAVNLALNKGNSITSYQTLRSFLSTRPAPSCVLMIFQYNWQHSYKDFFKVSVKQGAFTFGELVNAWWESFNHGLFPASNYNPAVFWYQGLRYYLQLDSLPLKELQTAIWNGDSKKRQHRMAQFEESRGYINNSQRGILTEDKFFNGDYHVQFLEDFQPSKTEDHYLHKIAALAEKHKFKFFVGSIPVSEGEYVERTAAFRRQRNAYVHNLFSGNPHVKILEFPETAARGNFFDFSHVTDRGAVEFTAQLSKRLAQECAR